MIVLSLLALGCFDAPAPAPEARPAPRQALRGGPVQVHGRLGGRPLRHVDDLGPDEPALVALVVLDTVRADHTSLCGYARPTTPTLERLREQADAVSCDAYSPAAWTLPAHATLFTGAPTAAHGVHTLGTPLPDTFETLAEHFAGRGYQTLFVSANPVFGAEEGGFWQGFDRVVVAGGLQGPLRSRLGRHLAAELEQADPTAPLFLVLNVFDAHDPWPAIPEGLGWVAPRPRTSLHPTSADPANPYYRFVMGEMPEAEQAAYLPGIQDAYDHGVHLADANLAVTVRQLARRGWLDRPHRVVVTSDHGEHLGEHGLLRHGSAAWQTVARVPFLYVDSARTEPLDLPAPVSTTVAWHLLRDGRLPEALPLVESSTVVNPDDFKPSWLTVAVWGSPTDKLMVFDGDERRYDLAADPGEERPLPVPADHPLRPVLAERLQAHELGAQEAHGRAPNEAVMGLLKELGYAQ